VVAEGKGAARAAVSRSGTTVWRRAPVAPAVDGERLGGAVHVVILIGSGFGDGQLLDVVIDRAGLDACRPADVHDAQRRALLQQGVDGGPADPKALGDFGYAQQRSDRTGVVRLGM